MADRIIVITSCAWCPCNTADTCPIPQADKDMYKVPDACPLEEAIGNHYQQQLAEAQEAIDLATLSELQDHGQIEILEEQLAELQGEIQRLRAENDELRNVVEHPPSVEKLIDNLADSLVSAGDEIDRLRKQLSGNSGDVTPQQEALRKGDWA